jgi:hypothetical protein
MTSPAAVPGLGAYRESVTLPFPHLLVALRSKLGAQLVAYLGGVTDAKAVRQWAAGERRPTQIVEHRLRLVYQVAGVLAEETRTGSVVQAWFMGANPALKDRSPARVLREYPVDEMSTMVLAAARTFAGGTDH